MMKPIRRHDLQRFLCDFDGTRVAGLEFIPSSYQFDRVSLQNLLSLIENEDENIQIGASWLILNCDDVRGLVSEREQERIIDLLASGLHWSVTLHFLQLIPRIQICDGLCEDYYDVCVPLTQHPRPFVRAWAYGALVRLGDVDESLRLRVGVVLDGVLPTEKASVLARIRNATKGSKWYEARPGRRR